MFSPQHLPVSLGLCFLQSKERKKKSGQPERERKEELKAIRTERGGLCSVRTFFTCQLPFNCLMCWRDSKNRHSVLFQKTELGKWKVERGGLGINIRKGCVCQLSKRGYKALSHQTLS